MIDVLIVDDNDGIRLGVTGMLMGEPDISVVGSSNDGYTAVKTTIELLPNVVLMDISMPEMDGIEATRQIIGRNLGVKVLAFSSHDDRHLVINMFKAGAKGYYLKESSFEGLSDAIRRVSLNQIYVSKKLKSVSIEECKGFLV